MTLTMKQDPSSTSRIPSEIDFWADSPAVQSSQSFNCTYDDSNALDLSRSPSRTSVFSRSHDYNGNFNKSESSMYIENDVNDEKKLLPTETVTSGSSTFGSIFLIVNAALGAGLLNMPIAFDHAGGVMPAILVQAFLLLFIVLALLILARTSDINQSVTLQEVMFTAAGKWGRRITSLIVTVYCFGTCITFLIIIGDQFDRAFASMIGDDFCHVWYYNRDFVMPISSLLLILPLCYAKSISLLKYASAFGVVIILYVVGLIFVEYSFGEHVPGPIRTRPDNWKEVFAVIPVICFGYQCHVSVIPIYSCMKHRNIKHFSIASCTAIAICVFTYTGAATFGYLTFGNLVSEDILSNYDARKPSVMIALVALSLKTFTTYPILLFCGREGLSTIVKEIFVKVDSDSKEKVRRYVIASIWFFATILLAIEIPNIGSVIDILGSFAAIFIFVFPGICLLQTTLTSDSLRRCNTAFRIFVALTFLSLGFFLFGVVLTNGIETIMYPKKEVVICKSEVQGILFYKNLLNL